MKLDIDKIESLINKNEPSKSAFAKKIGMTHSGFGEALRKSTLKIDALIKIAEHFQKPIQFFFTDNPNHVEEKSTHYGTLHINPRTNCSNPRCNEVINELLFENRDLQNEIRNLYAEFEKHKAASQGKNLPPDSQTP